MVMAMQMFASLFSVLGLGHMAAGSLELTVNPANIEPVLTNSLTVNCSFRYEDTSNLSYLVSIMISRAELGNDEPDQFVGLESIHVFAADLVQTMSDVNASASGRINTNGDSFLLLQWEYPTDRESGVYLCDAHGLDNFGRPVKISRTAEVTSSPPDADKILNLIQELRADLDQQKQNQSLILAELNECDSQRQNMTRQIYQLQIELECPFEEYSMSEINNGRYYLLSKQIWQTAAAAETSCELCRGYLAEVDDVTEKNFIKDFLNSLAGSTSWFVLTGGTDEFQEGYWEYRYSRRPMTSIDWNSGQPAGQPSDDCMVMYAGYGWQLLDYPCTNTQNEFFFLCEVPTP